jgi:hypothetical protein
MVPLGRAKRFPHVVQLCLMIQDQWIKQGHHNTLWLPQEYRSAISATYGNSFAFGLNSGQVNVLQLTKI